MSDSPQITPNERASLVSIQALLTDIAADGKKLVQLEAKLLRLEAETKLREWRTQLIFAAVGLACGLTALIFLGLAASQAMQTSSELPLWGCQLIVASLFLAPVALAAVKFRRQNPAH